MKKPRRVRGKDGKLKCVGCGEICGTLTTYLRRKARERNLEWNLTEEYLWKLFLKQDKVCALSGVELKFTTKRNKHNNIDRSILTASLDRIDSSIGYIEGNVQWVHKAVNIMKQSMSDKEFISWCIKIVNYANPEPSVENDIKVSTKVQRLIGEESTNNPDTSAQHPNGMKI